ncbi:hypothetical protein [Citrobacter phage Ci1]|nr:hypothetical protein [Citrobacter phage Ci1]
MNVMKALTNSQIVAVYTAFENGATKAQLSRDFNVNVKSITKAIDVTQSRRAEAAVKRASQKVQLVEKVLARPTKKVTVVAKPKLKKPAKQQRVPNNSAMADALKAALNNETRF